jgi:hypothetical protein
MFETSPDGRAFAVVKAQPQVNPAGRGDYGYLVPILYHGQAVNDDDQFLRLTIRNPNAENVGNQPGERSDSAAEMELSRVEIDFDFRD